LLLRIKQSDILPKKSNTTIDKRVIDDILSGRKAAIVRELRSSGQIK
jgi:hypothetical protein